MAAREGAVVGGSRLDPSPTSALARTCGVRSATLPARQRAALVLRYYEDLSEHDTAQVLGCSVAAVKSLVARGSETLRDLIRGEEA